ncbi:MAG: cation-translocating P-type ATPase [Clostridia bacterium]|nr:cation-translocating P-type ATPase [Clostridia bacterium]
MIWHSEPLDDIINILKTDKEKGLSNSEAQEKLKTYGSNVLSHKTPRSFFKCFLAQFGNFSTIAILCVAALSIVVTLITKDRQWFSPILIFAILLVNAAIAAYEEIKTEATTETLREISSPAATVIREGIKKVVDSSDLVPGDLIILKEGDYICADARIIASNALICNEAALTHSDAPVQKNADGTLEDIAPLAERFNMVFCGCSVMHGSALCVVTATGMDTELLKERQISEQTSQKRDRVKESAVSFAKSFNMVVLIVSALIFIIGMIYNFRNANISRTLIDMFLNAAAVAVAVIPEGLLTAISVTVALGMQRLFSKNIIVKDPATIERMGEVSVICADKTGTLTENRMRVTKIFNGKEIKEVTSESEDDIKMILELATICNNASESAGDPTGIGIAEACLEVCKKSKVDIDNLYPRLSEIPFDSTRKLMTTINMINERPFVIVKGAPENLLPLCTGNCEEKFSAIIDALASEGLRVIAVAARQIFEIPANPSPDDIERDLKFIGLIGLADSPREDAIRAVCECRKAGIRTVMLTSDHPATALAIGKQMGVLREDSELITGAELDAMSDEELLSKLENYTVYARISSENRTRIVKAWQEKGHVVSVTGDSVSDAPALMAADVGCAMGKSGTDVARGVSDIILTDDDFTTMVTSIKEGRAIHSNIRKVLLYLIGSNVAELLLMLLGVIIFGNVPLIASQLLWINLITDLFPVIMLGMEPPEEKILQVAEGKNIFSKRLVTGIATGGALMTVVWLICYAIGATNGSETATTMAFCAVILSQLFYSFSARRETESVIYSLISNKTAFFAIGISVATLLLITLSPLCTLFSLAPLTFGNWATVILLSLIPFIVSEGLKIFKQFKKA